MTIHWFTDSPDCGDPACICSACGELIAEKDAPAIRVFNDQNQEARFHMRCAEPIFGIRMLPDLDDD